MSLHGSLLLLLLLPLTAATAGDATPVAAPMRACRATGGSPHDSSKPAPLLMAYSSFSRSVDERRKLGSWGDQRQEGAVLGQVVQG